MVKIMMTLTLPLPVAGEMPAGSKCGRRGRRRLGRRSWHDLRSAMDADRMSEEAAGIGGVVLIRLPGTDYIE